MEATDGFKEAIKTYIEVWAMTSEEALAAYTDEKKKLDDCVTYILNQVKKSGVNGFADQEIFDMAIEYYTTKDIKVGGAIKNGQVVINRMVELTDKEKEEAKEKATRELISETKAKARKKPTTKKKPPSKAVTSVEKAGKAQAEKKAKEAKKEGKPPTPPVTEPTLF